MLITTEILDEIRRHGEDAYPEECCGLLLGRLVNGLNEVHAARRAVNGNEKRREDRYTIGPEDYRLADRAAREQDLDIVGIYHSHPDHPAAPSSTDLAQATFPGYTYVIISIWAGQSGDLTAWSLSPDRSRFLSEEIVVNESTFP